MSTIDALLKKRKQYYSLLDRVEMTKKNIDDSITYITYGIDSYQKSYTVDGKIADADIMSSVKDNLSNISNRLSVNIEKINYELSSLGKQIDRYYEDAATLTALASSKSGQESKDNAKGNENTNKSINTINNNSNSSNLPNKKPFRKEQLN